MRYLRRGDEWSTLGYLKSNSFFIAFWVSLFKFSSRCIADITVNPIIGQDKVRLFCTDFGLNYFFFLIRWSSFCRMECCSDLTAVDFLRKNSRFLLIYAFLSVTLNRRLLVFLNPVAEDGSFSLTGLWSSVNWLERELFDMFGLISYNHPNLRRLLTDYGFYGHPLRKDFPCAGLYEVFFSPFYRRLKYVKLVSN